MRKLRTLPFRVYQPLVVGLLVCTAPSALAQVANGTFTGSVTDPTGAVIPNATVTATNEGTNVPVSTKTNTVGLYTIPSLLPGFYTLKAEASGFRVLVNQHIELTVGYTQRVDFKLEVGQATQVVEVQSQAPLVSTEDVRMSDLVTARQVQNLPLNGRNVFQLIQLAPGAVNTTNLITEPGNRGFTTVVNGARVNMNGYYLDGISDKGLSGGSNTQPSIDTVQEFRVDTEAISAQYGSTVGAVTQIAGKTGTNSFHGTAYEFLRNEKLDAREFYEKPNRNPFKMNQFGATLGGPIKKNKLFFFGSYEGERTRVSTPQLLSMETPEFRNLIIQSAPNSVAALLYKNFPGPAPTGTPDDLTTYLVNDSSLGACTAVDAACVKAYGLDPNSGLGAALIANPHLPTFGTVSGSVNEESRAQFYDGNQWSGRIDYQGDKDRVFGRYFFDNFADPLYSPGVNGGNPSAAVGVRGFTSPLKQDFPQLALSWDRNLSPTVLNEVRVGWNRNVTDIASNNSGVPQISIDPGEVQFGNYAGYPQIFHEEVFHFSDMVTMTRGKHSLKFGADIQRNYENSEFDVGRPSYEFYDSVSFAAASVAPPGNFDVEAVAAGTDPGTVNPANGVSQGGAHLASNIRGWRNLEFGAFVQDDWKVKPRFTLDLGLRYDLYTRHTDKYGHVTQFVLPTTGANLTERLRAVNCYEDISGGIGLDGKSCNGGFAHNPGTLAPGDHTDFGPKFGFAWDVKGDGKTAVRGGFGISYQGEIYNPLSNSRWNPPFYSFNLAFCGSGTNVTGQAYSDACIFGPLDGSAPTYTGPPSNVGSGPAGATGNAFAGNIQGWNPWNANAAFLTGIVFKDFRDPYVYGSHFSLEHQFAGDFVLKTSWVGTFGHHLYRAEDINRVFGGRDNPGGNTAPSPLVGQCAAVGVAYRVNCLFGRLRVWESSVNSNYNALQAVLEKRMSHGLELHANYVWSHSLDTRSTWHSGATTSNGAAEGFSMDQANPGLDYGNSIFDVRHRFTLSGVWELPWLKAQQGFVGHALGGWQMNGAITLRGGFPWTPYCNPSSFPGGNKTACDYNRDGVRNDRPNQPAFGNANPNTSNAAFETDHPSLNLAADSFTACSVSPRPVCPNWTGAYEGNLGRNTFRGPAFQEVDFSLFKNFKVSERYNFQFRAEGFNIFNHTNLNMPIANFNGFNSGSFGLATSTFFPREIQFALKLIF